MTEPDVSVIIPTYNRALLLRETLESLQAQTYRDFEAIVVDDGSTDNTGEVVQSFDQRFRYVYQANRGRSSARNNGLSQARGRYIAFLDSDDLYLPCKLQVQVQCLEEHPEVGWVYSSTRNIDEQGRQGDSGYEATASGWIYPEIAFYIPLTVILSTVMVRREVMEAVGGFDQRMDRFEDTDMWRRISRQYRALAISEPLIGFRAHAGNTMEHPREVFQSAKYYVDKIFREDKDVDPELLRDRASEFFLHYGMAVWSQRHWKRYSRPFLRASLQYRRKQPQVVKWLLATYTGTWILSVDWWVRRISRAVLRGRRSTV